MKLLVLGGMHGNETLGIELVRLLQSKPIPDVEAALLNTQAIAANVRFVGQDLNRSFPGDITSDDYETKRAAEVLAMCNDYGVVFDFHNTGCPDNDCSFVGSDCEPLLFDVASYCKVPRVIVADYDCLNKYAPNCISIEISFSSPVCDAEYWYELIEQLATCDALIPATDVTKFRFAYRITQEDKVKYDLPSYDIRAFVPLNRKLADRLGVVTPAYPIFIGDNLTPYNYGGIVNKI